MTLTHITVFVGIALTARLIDRKPVSNWLILITSLMCVYWLQPLSSIRSLEFWLPSLLIITCLLIWLMITPGERILNKENIITACISMGVMLVISLVRYISPGLLTGIINPPSISAVLFFLGIASISGLLIKIARDHPEKGKLIGLAAILMLIAVFIILKYEPFTLQASVLLRKLNDQTTSLASSQEIVWVGYSYFAFRLIHVLREWQQGRVFDVDLRLFLTYVLFFPSFIAGPIDRLDRFGREYDERGKQGLNDDILNSGLRIAKGLFYKFVLADSLALVALNTASVNAVKSQIWMLVIVYAYALRLYFDFSGYTDLAVGIAQLMGIKLPENFNKPYRATNLTIFWNRWHITLTQWFRAYYFNPVTRYLRTRKIQIPAGLIIFFTQISTMILIGLWHGISLNFVLWGLWNGIGMFIQNRWSEWRKTHPGKLEKSKAMLEASKALSIILTFNYIALGWIWFALPSIQESLLVFTKLFGGA